MRQWIILTLAMLTSGCLTRPAATPTPIYEVPKVEPFVEPTATPVCQHFPGVTLETIRRSETTIELHVAGLQPGEKPTVIYGTATGDSSASRVEMYDFANGADEQGGFTVSLPGLRPPTGQSSAAWDIRFVHSRGVECTTVTLP